ncbi:MAG TPA: tetratricopeptide repeat protein [Candidatus Eisenbacteria bacterium]|nr:tetratricopeptide repeat protein [Candidatus Eisenbacteria bacterium]
MNQTQGHQQATRSAPNPGRIRARFGTHLPAIAIGAAGLLLGIAAAAVAGEQPAASTLKDVGLRYEQARLLPEAERVAGLEEVAKAAANIARGGNEDERASARVLAATVYVDRGDLAAGSEEFRRAVDGLGKDAFADDAAFSAIQSLEASGNDAQAAKEWADWMNRFPQSPLRGEALLAQAWNAVRRGEPTAARKHLATLTSLQPWSAGDPRVALAQATALYAQGKTAEASAALTKSVTGPTATYLRGLIFRSQGNVLRSAASFQEVADRYPDSPLRDPALLGKADAFLLARDYRSAAEEFSRAATRAKDPRVIAEAELRAAGAVSLLGASDSALVLLRGVADRHAGTNVGARAQFLIGDLLATRGQYAEAIVELNKVLTVYFQQSVAASAQYRVARCLDALGRPADATGSYQAVVSGYPAEPEAPAAAYLAGVGLLSQNRPRAAAPYFQIVLDRYVPPADSAGKPVAPAAGKQDVVDASLCLLLESYRQAGDLGQLAGAPHLLLQRMPPSRSPWRAYAMLIDADAMAAMSRQAEAQATLERLISDFPDHPVSASATKLLAWTYAQQGRDSLAIATEERLVARWGGSSDQSVVSGALLDIAHVRFNQKRYKDAAAGYDDFLRRFPEHPRRNQARYQAGLAYLRLNHAGDAVDRWEGIVRDSASAPIAEKAWARAGDLYFQAQRYEDAKRCYRGLLEHFAATDAAALATLRTGQCDYNAGRDADALASYSQVVERYPDSPFAKEARRGTELSLYRLGQSPKGAATLASLVEKYPTSAYAADALFQIGKTRYQAKEWAEAATAFRRVVSQFPGSQSADQAQFLMADALTKSGAKDEAANAYDQFLAFFPESELRPSAIFQLGLLRFESQDFGRAAVAFTQALEESASAEVRSASRFNLALCQRQLGQAEEARGTLLKHREEFPSDSRAVDVAYQLADLDEAAGRPSDAEAELNRALDAGPKGPLSIEILFRLGRVLETQGREKESVSAYERAAAAPDKKNAFRLSALARCAAYYEKSKQVVRAMDAYRDISVNSKDRELAAAAAGRASQLEAGRKRR